LDRVGARPVLVDVGASGAAHAPWTPVAHKSVFVGFDPDDRELNPALGRNFAAHHMIPKIVAGPDTGQRSNFYLTEFPQCSSMLEPDAEALAPYLFAGLFKVERTTEVETTTLAAVMTDLNLPTIDWLKVDTQGRDLSVIRGLDEARLNRLLCVEVEPGFTPFYRDEESFFQIDTMLRGRGFWLAHLKPQQFPRVRASTIKEAFGMDIRAVDPAARLFGSSPTAAEARYMIGPEALHARQAPLRDYVVAWTFAVATGLWGYALELAALAKAHPDAAEPRFKLLTGFIYDCVRQTVAGLAGSGARP
jgi:FkbM family methyltransferase